MPYPKIEFSQKQALNLSSFKEMDYFAVNNYHLPIEIMMENAGLNLAKLIANFVTPNQTIKIGIGNGNNGGGGLVAARRLAAWGYTVHLDMFTEITKDLPQKQLQRALKFGVLTTKIEKPFVWVDAYLGFSQHLPLHQDLYDRIKLANTSKSLKISLDIPTGFLGDVNTSFFKADKILTLAAPKKLLYNLQNTELYVCDLGIPHQVYKLFNTDIPPFYQNSILRFF